MSEKLTRTETIEAVRGKADDGNRVTLAFSSENPVSRFDFETGATFHEILSHQAGEIDLSRLQTGAHPLLVNHDLDAQVGVVEQVSIGADKKARATVRFSKSAKAQEILRDVRDGIRVLTSVGYRITKLVRETVTDGIKTKVFSWQPYEVSIVAIPADTTVGVGRSITETNKQRTFMNNELHSEIEAIASRMEGRNPEIRTLADRAIASGMGLPEFRNKVLAMLPAVQPIGSPEPLREVKPKDWKRYSLSRAIINHLDGKKFDGLERELSDEIAVKTGKRAGGFWLPQEVLTRNFIAGTGTLGGMLVQTENLASEFVELLRNKSQVINLGARVLNLNGPVTIPRQNAAGTANWVGETVAATLSTGNFTQLTLTPNGVSAFQQYSKQLLFESNPSIDSLIRDDITQILALAIDLACLHGTGSGQPTGIAGTSGIGTVNLATNGLSLANATAYPALVSLESVVSTANADLGAMAYLMRPSHRSTLRTQQRFSGTDSPVFTPDNKVGGYRAEVSNQISTTLTTGTATTLTSAIFFGNWNDVLIGNFNGGAIDLTVDPFTLAANAVVRLIARQWCDVQLRHPASFAVLGGIL